jgi:hypothetical protein
VLIEKIYLPLSSKDILHIVNKLKSLHDKLIMNKSLLFKSALIALAGLVAIPYVSAEEISESEALQIAMNFRRNSGLKSSGQSVQLELKYQLPAISGNALYVFAPVSGVGFTIVSGNDLAAPVLGYSDEGCFDANNLPSNVSWWLSEYQRKLNYVIENGEVSGAKTATAITDDWRSSLAYLLPCKWGQDTPYNQLCPKSYGSYCPTGCVATAVSQVMKYYEWPVKSTGYGAGDWSAYSVAHTYDWPNILNEYTTGNYTTAQGKAVAQLMLDVGYAVDMEYAYSGSGAMTDDVPPAMISNFNYDKSIAYIFRSDYDDDTWLQLMWEEIKYGRPIIYGGNSTAGGHQFVADGYNTGGYFHINWGWDGDYDGYFLLDALTPEGVGTGGGLGTFNQYQDAIINVMKPVDGHDTLQSTIACLGNFAYRTSSGSTVTFGVTSGSIWGSTKNGFMNTTGTPTIVATLGVKLIDATNPENVIYVSSGTSKSYSKFSTLVSTFNVDLSSLPESGKYYVYPVYQVSGESDWHFTALPANKKPYVLLTRTSGSNVFSTPSNPVVLAKHIYIEYLDKEINLQSSETSFDLGARVFPSTTTNPALSYTSSDENVAKVDETGKVVGVKEGTSTITVMAKDGSDVKAVCNVTVNGGSGVSSLATDENSVFDVYTLTGIRVLEKATNDDLKLLPQGIYVANGKKIAITGK